MGLTQQAVGGSHGGGQPAGMEEKKVEVVV